MQFSAIKHCDCSQCGVRYGLPVKWWTCVVQLYRRQLAVSHHSHKIVVLSALGRLVSKRNKNSFSSVNRLYEVCILFSSGSAKSVAGTKIFTAVNLYAIVKSINLCSSFSHARKAKQQVGHFISILIGRLADFNLPSEVY